MSACYVSAGRTEQGNVRRQNEDAILLRDDLGLWAVADGLGGHSAGDLASRMVVDALAALRRDGDLASFVDAIDAQLRQVNQQLRALARARRVDVIASTVGGGGGAPPPRGGGGGGAPPGGGGGGGPAAGVAP
ncbi:hypothetical protein QYG30_22495, partial [Xanthomonas perforans]|uniref:PP2C family protein-serine/threonine phosphatase n=1 Tax=Xanthomonas perforans TaxID=442694 RepID=UPI0032B6478B